MNTINANTDVLRLRYELARYKSLCWKQLAEDWDAANNAYQKANTTKKRGFYFDQILRISLAYKNRANKLECILKKGKCEGSGTRTNRCTLKWIPCTERMPNPGDPILVKSHLSDVPHFTKAYISFNTLWAATLLPASHWMPWTEPINK